MRTIKAKYATQTSLETRIEVETEVIVEDDADVREAGREAMDAIRDFTAGMAESEVTDE